MPFLGAVEFEAEVRISAVFVTPPGDIITQAFCTLVHEDGTLMGPIKADADDANEDCVTDERTS